MIAIEPGKAYTRKLETRSRGRNLMAEAHSSYVALWRSGKRGERALVDWESIYEHGVEKGLWCCSGPSCMPCMLHSFKGLRTYRTGVKADGRYLHVKLAEEAACLWRTGEEKRLIVVPWIAVYDMGLKRAAALNGITMPKRMGRRRKFQGFSR